MHDGSLSTLHEVVAFYNQGGYPHENLDPLIKPLELNMEEMDSLVVFLNSLTGDNIRERRRPKRTGRKSGQNNFRGRPAVPVEGSRWSSPGRPFPETA
jgi:cytochrome c peroxidase